MFGLLELDSVSGYSFRDKGVNGLIINWYYRRPNRRLIVVDPGVGDSEPPATARGAIANKWNAWLAEGRLTVVPTSFQMAAWGNLKQQVVAGL